MAATDWAATPIGPPEDWSRMLQVLVRSVQSSRYPMLLLWGEDYMPSTTSPWSWSAACPPSRSSTATS